MSYIEKARPSQPTVVFIHGFSAAAAHFDRVMPWYFERGYNVLAMDLPDHGSSTPHGEGLSPSTIFSTLVDFLEKIAPEKFYLVGNSLGGSLALLYAIHHPERLSGVVALSPAGGFDSEKDWDEFRKTMRIRTVNDARVFLKKIFVKTPLYAPLLYPFVLINMKRPGVRELLESTSFADFAEGARLNDVKVPLLFVWGKEEKLFPQKNLAWFRKHLPKHAVVETPENVGHCPQFDSVPWLNARMERFFGQRRPTAHN